MTSKNGVQCHFFNFVKPLKILPSFFEVKKKKKQINKLVYKYTVTAEERMSSVKQASYPNEIYTRGWGGGGLPPPRRND